MSKNTKRIEQAKELLTMIETMDHRHEDSLDKLDLGFTLLLNNVPRKGKVKTVCNDEGRRVLFQLHGAIEQQLYSRSRDALKAARPEGWCFQMAEYNKPHNTGFVCYLWEEDTVRSSKGLMPTEELAEFHAIVQAWIYVWEGE